MGRNPIGEIGLCVPERMTLKVMQELSERNPFLECASRASQGLRCALIDQSDNFRAIWDVVDYLKFKPMKVFLEELLPCAYATHDSEPFKWIITRLHIPIVTNDLAKYLWEKSEMNLKVGRIYAVDPLIPYRLSNEGFTGRLHLVIDVNMDDWKL